MASGSLLAGLRKNLQDRPWFNRKADFYSILAQAVGALDPSAAEARCRLYDRARFAMISKLEAAMPPFHRADVALMKIAFESAVARVEADVVQRGSVEGAGNEAPPLSPDREAGASKEEGVAVAAGETWLTDLLERASDGAGDGQNFAPRRVRAPDA